MTEAKPGSSYYDLLGLPSSATPQEIRRAYRELSKLYHPDTTQLSEAIATAKFQELNDAYATLSSPDRRFAYDLKYGYSRIPVIQTAPPLHRSAFDPRNFRPSSYRGPAERPLSPGEIFALFILGLTFVACLILVVTVGLTRSDVALHTLIPTQDGDVIVQQQTIVKSDELGLPESPMAPSSFSAPTEQMQAWNREPLLELTPSASPTANRVASQSSAPASPPPLELNPDEQLVFQEPVSTDSGFP